MEDMIQIVVNSILIIVIIINIFNTRKKNRINKALTKAHESNRKVIIELKDALIKYIES